MPEPKPYYNLSLTEAIEVLEAQSEKNRAETASGAVTHQLEGMSVDDAYDVGYDTLLHDLKSITGPDPMEVFVVQVPIKENPNA